jgi:hypothetical protein
MPTPNATSVAVVIEESEVDAVSDILTGTEEMRQVPPETGIIDAAIEAL